MKIIILPVNTKSENRLFCEMEEMKIGHTKVLNGHVITRWAYDSFEVGTWGKLPTIDIQAACTKLLEEDKPLPAAASEIINANFWELLA